jgi:hypothetical protein
MTNPSETPLNLLTRERLIAELVLARQSIHAMEDIIKAARCIHWQHWHDSDDSGMIVNREHVFLLWSALEKFDRLTIQTQNNLSEKTPSDQKNNPTINPVSDRNQEQPCSCRQCLRDRDEKSESGLPAEITFMILCAKCGNKRCPHATNHQLACTKINEPGQPGRFY